MAPRCLFCLCLVLFLCACASKRPHQPIGFEPYFPTRPASHFTLDSLSEMRLLESSTELSLYEKKRLLDLYQSELKTLKPGTSRHQLVATAIERLQWEVSPLERELRELQDEIARYKDVSATEEKPTQARFQHREIKKEYLGVYHLWNRDQNEKALKRIESLLRNERLRNLADAGEWMKLLNLRFRISVDTAELSVADGAYREMVAFEKCDPDTAQAGFLLAMHYFAQGEYRRAYDTFEGQCDPDTSPSNRIRRLYWKGRLREALGVPKEEAYAELLRSRVPGYYLYLARTRLGSPVELPRRLSSSKPSYLSYPLDISEKARMALVAAEERLKARLRRDATFFLKKAGHLLREDKSPASLRALLYVAHLFKAAGNPLEAMKIYAFVTTELLEEHPDTREFPLDFLSEMFPRPHEAFVESLSRQWNLDADFIYAIMRQESAFNPAAISGADARGLMQLMPALARSLSEQWKYQSYYSDKQLFHAEENLKLAIYHLHQLQTLVPHMALVAASYNAGLSRVSGWWKRNGEKPLDVFVELIPVNETRNYVKLVLRNYVHYKALRTGGTVDPTLVSFSLPLPGLR